MTFFTVAKDENDLTNKMIAGELVCVTQTFTVVKDWKDKFRPNEKIFFITGNEVK